MQCRKKSMPFRVSWGEGRRPARYTQGGGGGGGLGGGGGGGGGTRRGDWNRKTATKKYMGPKRPSAK